MNKTETAGGRFRKDDLIRLLGIALLLGSLGRAAAERVPFLQSLIDMLSVSSAGSAEDIGPRLSK